MPSVTRLVALLHPAKSRWKTLAVFVMSPEITGFFDESGARGGDDDVFTVGGFVARAPRWKRIERIWNERLGRRVFHMTDFESRHGEFTDWPKDKKRRLALIAALADSLQGNEAFGTAHSLHFSSFRKIICPDARPGQAKGLAYAFLLTACLSDITYRFDLPRNERFSVVCEECAGVVGITSEFFQQFKQEATEHKIGQLTFAEKGSFRGLQAQI